MRHPSLQQLSVLRTPKTGKATLEQRIAPRRVHIRLSGATIESQTAGKLDCVIMTCGRDEACVLEGRVIGKRG